MAASNSHNRLSDETLTRDRISQLPEPILVHILSFLSTFDAVFRAGLVSKCWSSLWTLLPSLSFRESELNESSDYKFMLYVDNVIYSHDPPIFESCCFEFRFYRHSFLYQKPKIDGWIRFLLRNRRVKKLELLFTHLSSFPLPNFLFRNEVLTRLCLRKVTFKEISPQININLKSLRSLSIEEVADLGDVLFQKILVGCPLLESLRLAHCEDLQRLDINSTSLRHLVLHHCKFSTINDNSGAMLRISAPFLQDLAITGFMNPKKFYLGESILLVNGYVSRDDEDEDEDDSDNSDEGEDESSDSDEGEDESSDSDEDEDEDETVEEYDNTKGIETLTSVKKLTLGTWGLQVFVAKYGDFNCKSLTLDINIKQWELPGLATMLQKCPELERLTINMKTYIEIKVKSNYINYDYGKENYWELNPDYRSCNCLLRHLKTVNIVGLDVTKGSKRVIDFLEFILKHAKVLETLSIDIDLTDGDNSFNVDDKKDFQQLSMLYMLTGFPKSSPNAVIQVVSRDCIKMST